MKWVLLLLSLGVSSAAPQDAAPQPQPVLDQLRLEGATVFTREDVLWLLKLREGAPLPAPAAEIAKSLRQAYERDGYSEAKVSGAFDAGRLVLTVDEGRIDEIEILGVSGATADRLRRRLGVKPGDIYNRRVIGREAARLTSESLGALVIGRPRRDQPDGLRGESAPDSVILDRRGARNVLVIPLRWRIARVSPMLGSGRDDLFSPVDGLSAGLGVSSTIFDHAHFNHTFLQAYVSYKFGRDAPGYSIGAERPFFGSPKLFLGAEVHDMTASDDQWRLSSFEQTFVSLAFKNTFRDYYRRRGGQVFGVVRMGDSNELSAIARSDRHEPLENATTYSFFRDDASYRPNLAVIDQRVNALVLAYTLDTRGLTGAGQAATYGRHVKDNLFGQGLRQRPGFRIDWTSEIAGRGLQGDADFDRHILNARGYVGLTSRTLLSVRGLFGFSHGTLPVERQFAIGGIGSVHGYRFKEAAGAGMALLNAEYRFDLTTAGGDREPANVFVFYDAGRVTSPVPDRLDPFTGVSAPGGGWLRGVGVGAGAAGLRVEFGFRADAIPRSRQILVRFSPTF
jgi:outer membrane protein assembly factor BamA